MAQPQDPTFIDTSTGLPYVDPNAPLQRLGSAISGAFSNDIPPAAPGQAGPITLPGMGSGETRPAIPVPTPGISDPVKPPPDAASPSVTPPNIPIPTPGIGDQPLYVEQTTTETQDTTSGVTKESAKEIKGATDDANKAVDAAGKARIDELNTTAELERKQSRDAYARGVNKYFEDWGKLQTEDEVNADLTKRLDETARFKPDRSELFKGDNGVMFGISAAIAAMAGGWLMGQGLTGGKNPYLDSIMRMIEDNANDQIEANSLVYRELARRLGNNEAARKELKARMLEDVDKTVAAQARFEKASPDLVQKGAAAVQAEVQKEAAKNRMEAAKLTAQTASHTVQKKKQMVLNPAVTGGVDINDPKQMEAVGRVGGLMGLYNEFEGLIKSGVMADNVGFLDEKWNWVKGAFQARDPGQARVERAKQLYETLLRQNWKSEPNGIAAQERLSSIGLPRNESEFPVFLEGLREVISIADPGGRLRQAHRLLNDGNTPRQPVTGRIPVVR